MRKLNLLIILLILLCFGTYAQTPSQSLEVICTAGDFYKGNGVTLSWTLGEPVIETFQSTNNKVLLTQGFQQPNYSATNTYTLDGYVTYNNTANTPITNTWVILTNAESTKLDSSETDINGHFIINNVSNGTYTLNCTTTLAWGSSAVNPVDALLINRNYIGSYKLTTFRKIAGDVAKPLNGNPNPIDALYVNRRYIHSITKFEIPDWVFQQTTVMIAGENVTQNILALCAGDVKGAYTPPIKKLINNVDLQNEGVVFVNNLQEFELPVTATSNMTVGAMGLVINYPSNYLQVKEVITKLPGIVYNISDNQVRVAFSDAGNEGFNFNANDTIVKLKMTCNNLIANEEISLTLDEESILADAQSITMEGATLNIPRIALSEVPTSGYYLSQNYPNPFNNTTRIDYRLPELAGVTMKLYDILGNEISELVNGNESSGYHNIIFNSKGLASGLYMYTLIAKGANSQYTKTRILVINQ